APTVMAGQATETTPMTIATNPRHSSEDDREDNMGRPPEGIGDRASQPAGQPGSGPVLDGRANPCLPMFAHLPPTVHKRTGLLQTASGSSQLTGDARLTDLPKSSIYDKVDGCRRGIPVKVEEPRAADPDPRTADRPNPTHGTGATVPAVRPKACG